MKRTAPLHPILAPTLSIPQRRYFHRKYSLRLELFAAGIPLCIGLALLASKTHTFGSIRLLVWAICLCSVLIFLNRIKIGMLSIRPASTAILFAFIFWYSYPAVVSYISSESILDAAIYSFASNEQVIKSLSLLSIFLFCLILGSNVRVGKVSTGKRSPVVYRSRIYSKKRLLLVALAACVLGTGQYFLFGFSLASIFGAIVDSRGTEKPWFQLNNLGSSTSPFTFIASSAMLAGAAVLWVLAIDGKIKKSWRMLSAATATIISLVLYYDQGTRANLVVILSPLVAVAVIQYWKRHRVTVIIGGIIILIIGIAVLQYQTAYRSPSTREYAGKAILKDWYTLGHTIDYFRESVFAVSIVPSGHSYFREINVVHFLLSPIPRFLWGGKPVSELVRYYTLEKWNIDILEDQGNAFPGIVGQYYMSWGWLGPVLIGIAYGLISRALDKYMMPTIAARDIYRIGLGALLVSWMVLCYRILSPAYLYPVLFYFAIISMGHKARIINRGSPKDSTGPSVLEEEKCSPETRK